MSDSKRRAALRAQANRLDTIIQIGKDGITDNLILQIDGALQARELIKIRVLETAMLTAREASEIICERTKCEPVQCIGTRIVLFRENAEKHNKNDVCAHKGELNKKPAHKPFDKSKKQRKKA